jgi:hypothetical protein
MTVGAGRRAHGISFQNWKVIVMETQKRAADTRVPLNKGKLTGRKPPLKFPEIWASRARQQISNIRGLALFNLAIDSKLRACDLTRLLPKKCGEFKSMTPDRTSSFYYTPPPY